MTIAPARAVLPLLVATLTALMSAVLSGQEPGARDTAEAQLMDTLVVTGRSDDLIGTAATASEGRVGAADLRLRPIMREAELLETVPGFIATQHSGDGKANQYFVRGFNLDHGTDFQTRVEGMPVNMSSHAHGQGYTDVNFLIPELVDHLDYRLGVYHAELGDFGSASGAEFHLMSRLDRPFASVEGGENGLARLVSAGSTRLGEGDLLAGGEAKMYDGPWDVPQELRKFSGLARYTWGEGASRFSILGMAYRNQWNASDQIPQRAVDAGLIGRFGQIDGTDGGETRRYSLSASWRRAGMESVQDVQLFAIYSDLSLFSNFAYFLDDPVLGDQFNQRESRVVMGGSGRHVQEVSAFGLRHLVKLGLQTRADLVDPVGLHRSVGGRRTGTIREDVVRQWGTGLYAEAESRWRPWLRTVLGARGDVYLFDVSGNIGANAGERSAGIVSPKASVVLSPSPSAELYLSAGFGFHSNDARGTTIRVDPVSGAPADRVDPLVRSRGAEIGLRATPATGWRSTLALWALDLDSELLFIGDGGATEASSASTRRGVTWANFYRPLPGLSVDFDVSLARARFGGVSDGQDYVPGALERVVAAGVTYGSASPGPFGSLRLRHFGSYPLTEDNALRAGATTLLNADAGLRLRSGLQLQVTVLNLLDSRHADIQYYYFSRLRGEPAEGVGDVHFHPAEPRQVRMMLAWGL